MNGNKTVTLADIAVRAGVSSVTVSKALSGQKGVSEKVREQIRELAEEMGYSKPKRNPFGEDNSVTIGILVAGRFMKEEKSFYWSLIQHITRFSFEKNSFCILEAVETEDEKSLRLPGLVSGRKADGLIVIGNFRPEYEKEVIQKARMPVLFADARPADSGCDAVVTDNYTGAWIVTDYLLSLGCRRIAFVGTLLETSSIDERYFGYLRALIGKGIRFQDEWLIQDRDPEVGVIDPVHFIRLPDELPEAFFCNCDRTAKLLIEKLENAGLRVPEDILVAGFDNFLPGGGEEEAGITTYAVDMEGMAKKVVHMIRHKIQSSYSYGLVSVSGSFLERGSTQKRKMETK